MLEEVQNQPLKLSLERSILQNKQANSSPKTALLRDIQNRKQKKYLLANFSMNNELNAIHSKPWRGIKKDTENM